MIENNNMGQTISLAFICKNINSVFVMVVTKHFLMSKVDNKKKIEKQKYVVSELYTFLTKPQTKRKIDNHLFMNE